MSAPKSEQEVQGYSPLPPPPQQLAPQYPTLPQQHIAPQYPPPAHNPYAQPQAQYVQPPPPQTPQAQVQYVQPPPPQIPQAHVQYLQPPPPPSPPPYPYPSPQQGNPLRPTEWSAGLFACTEDPSLCCVTCWCPCITFGQIAEIVDEGSPTCAMSGGIYALLCLAGYGCAAFSGLGCLSGFAWCYSCSYRTRMRAKYNLVETPCMDCLLHCCCDPCALCQEYKELKYRGYDPALGWAGNLQRRQRETATAMAPPVNPTMQK